MPEEGNGSHDRISALEKAHKELEDAVIVMAHLENRMSEQLREHAQFISQHEASLKKHDQMMADLDVRIAQIVSAIGSLVSRIPPENLH